MQGFMHFYCEKPFVARNQAWGSSSTSGSWQCTMDGGWKFSRGSTLPTRPVSLKPGSF